LYSTGRWWWFDDPSDSYALVADGGAGRRVMDISDSASPQRV
jgi:hypothetical protein